MAKARSARAVALEVLRRVEEGGAYANLLLPRALASSGLEARDRALATELVYGTVRTQGTLDWALSRWSSIPLDKLDPPVLAVLRLGAYQLLFTRVPARAACYTAVEQAKEVGHAGSAGFVNAVLRRLARERDRLSYPDLNKEPVRHIALKYFHPEWLVARWLERLGVEETIRLCRANNEVPPLTLRTNTVRISRSELVGYFEERGFAVGHFLYAPEALHLKEAGAVERLPGFSEGLFTVQDESSMLAAHALAPRAGERVLDACAGPGGKTTHLAELMGNAGEVTALDVHPHKVELVQAAAARLGLSIIQAEMGDARRLPEAYQGRFDRVLVDAPCSGTGVLRRRPDLRWHKSPEEIASLPPLQLAILTGAAAAVAPGGVLVYSTCSIEPEENLAVVRAFLAQNGAFRLEGLAPQLGRHLSAETLNQGYLQLYPHRHRVDGFFLARLRRQGR
ncbi:MAG TPA: 16S rRNA (cytosine(967)-C(5))-methyltransferase RsmB [Firmicutes bacterium]|uniref:16S rRNA (cytosine(967)-C(5))-methyltransferase RsmB n=1 Tax=Gelria sp. Kuro-4 TaxID=2796927 RepID=UPI0019910CA6|nr:16S rRNA (cytosine(967)-C(5))-methyltransferase RsmB [Gelria sp. Kuro-4]BCV24747.1 ribosomal RNA small subunit methyltransferase B [Gelria sp. Kuro-4]HHV57047.1 16S rRNA (cytosine(967)-C(5))-methyltransferase RsmB [Bacillota bacterium]